MDCLPFKVYSSRARRPGRAVWIATKKERHNRDHRHMLRTKWAAPVLAEARGALAPHLNTSRHTIRIPREQQALGDSAALLFA